MAKKKTTTEVATLGDISMTKEGVPDMLKLVNEQIKAIRKGLPKSNSTSGAPDGFPFNVEQCRTVDDLTKMHSFISAKEKAYNSSVSELGLTKSNYPCKISGHSPAVWKKDIAFRLNEVKNKTKLDKLSKVRALLEKNLSEKERFKKEMQDMAGIITNLGVD